MSEEAKSEMIGLCGVCGTEHDLRHEFVNYYHIPRRCAECETVHSFVEPCALKIFLPAEGKVSPDWKAHVGVDWADASKTVVRFPVETDGRDHWAIGFAEMVSEHANCAVMGPHFDESIHVILPKGETWTCERGCGYDGNTADRNTCEVCGRGRGD
jgi:hypothetical protein